MRSPDVESPERGSNASSAGPVTTLIAIATIILSFVPYAALSVGASTNLPLTTFGCVALIVITLRHRGVFWVTFVVVVAPLAATGLQLAVGSTVVLIPPLIAWITYSLAVPGAMAAYLVLGTRLRPLLAACVVMSAVIVFVQYAFIRRGLLPWQWYYDAPGYHPVVENAETILLYNNRPFGLFPEPSFMAGTLAMTCMLVMILCLVERRPYGVWEFGALAATFAALLLSESGSAVVTLGLLAFVAVLPLIGNPWVIAALPPVTVATLVAAISVLGDRSDSGNLSWIDRSSSLLIGWDRFTSSTLDQIVGLGIGVTTRLFELGAMPSFRYEHYHPVPDVYSVTLRVLMELGVLIGLPVLLWLCLQFVVPVRGALFYVGLAALACWAVVSVLTVTYHSAFWICGMPGVMAVVREQARRASLPSTDSDTTGSQACLR